MIFLPVGPVLYRCGLLRMGRMLLVLSTSSIVLHLCFLCVCVCVIEEYRELRTDLPLALYSPMKPQMSDPTRGTPNN